MLQDNLVYFLPSPRIRPSSISLIVLGFFNWRRVLETKTQVHSVLIAPGVSLPSRLSQLTKQDLSLCPGICLRVKWHDLNRPLVQCLAL